MNQRRVCGWLAACALAAGLFGAGSAVARNDDYERLAVRLDQLAADPVLGTHAPAAMGLARSSLQQLKDARRGDREYWTYMTERRIDTARVTAEAEVQEQRRAELQRENDRLQLALARRDADQARAELERQRLQSQIRAEEAERLRQEAATARAEGEQATQAAEAARAEANQARRMADAQAKAAALARKEAELSSALEGGGKARPAPSKVPRKSKKKASASDRQDN